MRYFLLLLTVALHTAFSASGQRTRFQLIKGDDSGIRFANTILETESFNVLSYEYFFNGGGVAAGDINNDGLIDLFFTSNMGANTLYLNLGNRKFQDVTASASPMLKGRKDGWKTGATMADVNGDGWLDIYVCYSGKGEPDARRNQLFINNKNGSFTEMAAAYGLDAASLSTQAAFFDFDNDGDLDMFLLNHSNKKIDNMELARYRKDVDTLAGSKLFENRNGQFVEVSAEAGIRQSPLTYGLGLVIADINLDGWPDIYVTNDYNEPDYCYINQKNGRFKDESANCFRHMAQFSMGADVADFNNDGLPDLINLDMLPEDNKRQKLLQLQENYEAFQLMRTQQLHKQYMRNMLQLNNGDGTFSEIAQLAGVSNTDWSWCPLFADFDNDGFKDLFITNGYLRDYTNKDFLRYWGDYKVRKAIDREPAKLMDLVQAMPSTMLYNYAFRNEGNLSFSNQQMNWGFTHAAISSGAVYADIDNDGDLDLIINCVNKEAAVYENLSAQYGDSNYLNIQLSYKHKNGNGLGTKLYIYTGNRVQYYELSTARGYLSSLPQQVHAGLGSFSIADSVRLIWPDQTQQMVRNLNSGKHLISYKPNVENTALAEKPKSLLHEQKNWTQFTHRASDINDFKRQLLMPFMYSKTGPVLAKADVDGNGTEDLFIGGAIDKLPELLLQQKDGGFKTVPITTGSGMPQIADAVFADLNRDGHMDLYLAMGGYGYLEPGDSLLQDQVWVNDGKGVFVPNYAALPDMRGSAKSCVRAADYDHDGDIDLFVGGYVIPGKYPVNPESFLLVNNGSGQFSKAAVPFSELGMITDAHWVDLDKNGSPELVLTGEFMGVQVFAYKNATWVNITDQWIPPSMNGIWFSIATADLDNDGWMDLVLGNIGNNSPIKFSEAEPATLYYGDVDNNGSIDPFLNFFIQGKSYPFVSRDELNEQMYPMRKKFASYKDYATATMSDILDPTQLSGMQTKTANESRTIILLNKKTHFEKQPLPVQAQFSAVTAIEIADFNKDGLPDILLMGNKSDNRLKIGAIDANYGCLLTNVGNGNFDYVPQPVSGLKIGGDVKSSLLFRKGEERCLLVAATDEAIQCYKF